MKKIILVLILILITLTLAVSCKKNGNSVNNTVNDENNNSTDEPPSETVDEDVIYSEKFSPVIILGEGIDASLDSDFWKIYDPLSNVCETAPLVKKDDFELSSREIVVGDTERALTKKARELLDKAVEEIVDESGLTEDEASDIVGYAIYAEGNSIAIVWNNDYILDISIDYFAENYFNKSSLKLDNGHLYTDVFSLTEYVDERDEAIISQKWADIESEIGGDVGASVVNELKKLYLLYNDNVISWLANLYDPEAGGFYHSNSGRNNYGFLPDIESTYSALGFLDASGMNDDIDGNFADVLPDDIKEQIINFIYNLQSEDGYFYHPQWGKAITDGRRGRDLSSATIMLNAFNVELKYPYPGSAVSAANFTRRLSEGPVVAAASRVMAVSTVPEKFQSEEKFIQWLDGMNFTTGAYHAGSDLQSLINEMISYGKSTGIDFMGIAIARLNQTQNQSNGLWHPYVNYYGTNGLHKIAYFYNQAKAEFPNAELAIKSTFESLLTDETPSAAVDVYNAWSCVGYLVDNIRYYSNKTDADSDAKADEIINEVRALAPTAIAGTANKLSLFAKPDGSFSYSPKYSTPTAEGCKVALVNTEEGDINGTGTIICATVQHIFEALDIAEYIVPRYTTSDKFRFISLLSELGAIVKTEYEKPAPYTFEDDDLGAVSLADFYFNQNSTGDGVTVIEHDRGGENKRVLRIDSNNDGGDVFQFKNTNYRPGAYSVAFEGDIFIDEMDTNYVMTLSLLPGYMLAIKNISGRATLFEETTNQDITSITRDLGIVFEKKNWYTLKIEQYFGDHETVRTVVTVNGKAVAVSDGYKGKPKDGSVGTPSASLDCMEVYVTSGKFCTILLDNLNLYYGAEEYKPMVLSDEKYLNVDDPNSTWGIVPEGTKVNQTIELDTKNEMLDTSVFEATLNFTEATGGSHLAKISFIDTEDNTVSEYLVYCQDYDKSLVGNPRYRIRIYKDGYLSGANVGNKMEQDITFKIEYCFVTGEVKVSTNGSTMEQLYLNDVSENPIAKVVFTNLDAYSKFTYSDVKAENIETGKAGTEPVVPVKPDPITKDVTNIDENPNTLTTEFKINYSKIASGQHMNLFSFLDKDGNVINSIKVYCQAYDPTNATESEKYRIRPYADGVGYLSGANVGNKMGMDITVRIEYEWTTGKMKVYTNGNLVEHTFTDSITPTPIASVKLEALVDTVVYTAEITKAEATEATVTPPETDDGDDETETTSTLTKDVTVTEGEINLLTTEFKINYSKIASGQHMNVFSFLDKDGNVINSINMYCQAYDPNNATESEKYRIRPFVDGFGYLSGANVGNKMGMDITVRIEYDWTTGAMKVYTNGNLVEHTFADKATNTPIASVKLEALVDTVVYTAEITMAEVVINASSPSDEENAVIKTFTDATAEGEEANNASVAFTVNYSSLLGNEPLASIELLDEDGNVINTVYLYSNLYDNSQSALSDKYRIRVSGKNSDGYISLIGAGLGNRPERDISFVLDFNYTDAKLTITCNGNVGGSLDISSYEGNAKSVTSPASLRFTPLSENATYTIDFTRVELNKI